MQPPLDRPHLALVHREARRASACALSLWAACLLRVRRHSSSASRGSPPSATKVRMKRSRSSCSCCFFASFLPLAFSLLSSNLATKCARPIAGLGLLAKPDWRQSSFCSMLLSPWRLSRRPPDDVSRGDGDGPEWPSTPCRVDRRMGADRAPVRLARAEGLRAHPPDGAVRWPDLRARGGGGGRAASERTLQRRVARFEAEGMESLFGSEHARRKRLPDSMRQ